MGSENWKHLHWILIIVVTGVTFTPVLAKDESLLSHIPKKPLSENTAALGGAVGGGLAGMAANVLVPKNETDRFGLGIIIMGIGAGFGAGIGGIYDGGLLIGAIGVLSVSVGIIAYAVGFVCMSEISEEGHYVLGTAVVAIAGGYAGYELEGQGGMIAGTVTSLLVLYGIPPPVIVTFVKAVTGFAVGFLAGGLGPAMFLSDLKDS